MLIKLFNSLRILSCFLMFWWHMYFFQICQMLTHHQLQSLGCRMKSLKKTPEMSHIYVRAHHFKVRITSIGNILDSITSIGRFETLILANNYKYVYGWEYQEVNIWYGFKFPSKPQNNYIINVLLIHILYRILYNIYNI